MQRYLQVRKHPVLFKTPLMVKNNVANNMEALTFQLIIISATCALSVILLVHPLSSVTLC